MLKKILKSDECAKCRVCCIFDKDDIWEAPLITPELADYIRGNIAHEQTFIPKGKNFVFDAKFSDDGLNYCPMLTEKGCVLGDKKPFDCKIWPFRIMERGNQLLLTISPVCESISTRPIGLLSEFVQSGFANIVFDEAKHNSDMVKPYIEGYPILEIRDK